MRGRDIGQGLVSLIEKLTKKRSVSSESFTRLLWEYYSAEKMRLVSRDAPESALDTLTDRVQTLEVMLEGTSTTDEVIGRISTIFQDVTPESAVLCSSVHRAKGLEAEDVVILRPELLPLKKRTELEMQQERNIQYVAYTRAKRALTFITTD